MAAAGVLLLANRAQEPVTITWNTESEIETAGYNVLRRSGANTELVKLNENLIPSQADPLAGGSYEFVDDSAAAGERYEYILEDVELDGTTTRHEPIVARASQQGRWLVLLGLVCASVGIGFLVYAVRFKS